MTKEEYLALKDVPIKDWSYVQCTEADALIKVMATQQFAETITAMNLPKILQDYIILMVRIHFGSVETDDLLTTLKCYPDWMCVHK